ncbi:MAG: NAD(P)H-dependent oxidoreductase [Candidatus Daviesbacteria bacterium]|nr:NAD(P)H-dependent oxidoreductase [Candidatus Daviesbacteria bacterium]
MKVKVISYSLTGNNEALASSIANEFSAEHIKITESKPRTIITIILDILFNRTPQVSPRADIIVDKVKDNDLVLFIGPVWMGQIATPLRAYLEHLKTKFNQYAFISISGGAAGPNPKLADELKKRVGKKPVALINLYIADLLPSDPKPTMKDTSAYHLKDSDVKNLTNTAVKTLRKTMIKKENS